ncbi:MAG: hypothetical protein ACOC58_02325 [Chloroflexota bacterium]
MEGPLSIHGNARELMKLLPDGAPLFDAIRRYDALLRHEGRDDYEPGDALAFIVPFLLHHGVTGNDISNQADNAVIVPGAAELIASLADWDVYCITTSYHHYARRIMGRVGIATENLASTAFPIHRHRSLVTRDVHEMVAAVQEDILAMPHGEEEALRRRLDRFYLREVPASTLAPALQEVNPVGGRRKLEALQKFLDPTGYSLSDAVAVGDSITDAAMLDAVNRAGGLAIAFNADEHSLPSATIALASTHLSDLGSVLSAWQDGGTDALEVVMVTWETVGGRGHRDNFYWVTGRTDHTSALAMHRTVGHALLSQAGKLR